VGGRLSVGFNAGAVNNTDRSLAVGKASAATFTTKFVNDTANKLTEIELYYDMECPWVSKGKTVVTAKLFGQISTNGTTWVSLPQLDSTISNSYATTTETWLTDAQMDAQKLSKRNVGGIIPLPATLGSIQKGQVFYIRWVTDSDNASYKMTYGVDNLRGPADSDGDGLSDAKEVLLGTNPLNADSDSDGLSDGNEVSLGTSPLNSDSDADGLADGQEVSLSTDPLNPDSDADGLSDGNEVSLGTSPLNSDSDADGLSDAQEVSLGTNPLNADSDGDGMSDGEEVDYCTCPTNSASLFSIELTVGAPPSPELDSYLVGWPTADGRFYTLLFSETMTGTFTPVEGCVRIPGAMGTDVWCSHVTDSETGFYKVLIETE